jgi:hypothetical protein
MILQDSDNVPKVKLEICPTCKERSLMLDSSRQCECLNVKCEDYLQPIFKVSIEKAIEAQKIQDESRTKAKDWRDGDKPVRVHRIPTWLIIVGACVVVSIVITLILNHVQPGSRFSFFAW